jgi:radical SAM protein with 4Fe4S-binding SPASM domain
VSAPGEAEAILDRFEASSRTPLRAMIEVSDRCNEVCVHCYQEQGRKGELGTDELCAVIDELAERGVLFLTISGGEATLRKDFLEIVAHARARGFAIRLYTNGLTMTDALAQRLHELAVHVVEVSLYSHRAEVHDFVTGVPGSFDKTVAGIRALRARGVDTHVKTPIMTVNEHELEQYMAFAGELGVTYGFDPGELMPREAESRAPDALSRSLETYKRVKSDPRLDPLVPGMRKARSPESQLCGAGEYLVVEPNGVLRPCTMLHVDLGDATAGLGDALQSEAYGELLGLRWKDVHGCRSCDLGAYCGRCHARALAEVGDALAPYPSACARALASYEVATGATPVLQQGERAELGIGPYRLTAQAHTFETALDDVAPEDDARATRLGWVRNEARKLEAPAERALPGALVQLRRPGRARAHFERIPDRAQNDVALAPLSITEVA